MGKKMYGGWMKKRSKYLKEWNDRYVALSPDYLLYFELGDQPNTHKGRPNAIVRLTSIK